MIFIFVFQRISEQNYLKKDCCMRQNKVIERIVEQYWYSVACQEGMGNIVVYQNV